MILQSFISTFLLLICVTRTISYDNRFDRINPPVNLTKIESYFAICAIVKNEMEEDLREWVEYHHRMGASKFYIHDNGKIPAAGMLQDYIKRGIVVVRDRKDVAPQLSVYHRCIRNYRTKHRWIGFIDADEFIVTKNSCSIPSLLKEYEDYGGLTLQWKIYCSSGHRRRPPGGTLANYHTCFSFNHVKTIANTDFAVSHYGNPHVCHYSHGKYAVDIDFQPVGGPLHNPSASLYTKMYINHYHLKSKEDYDRNRRRGRASTIERGNKTEQYFWEVDSLCHYYFIENLDFVISHCLYEYIN